MALNLNSGLLVYSSSNSHGFSLIELLVTLVIVSSLSMISLPYAQNKITREKEYKLRHSLQLIRNSIDKLHTDWRNGKIDPNSNGISKNGFPEDLNILVDGVTSSEANGRTLRYIRRIPPDPFASSTATSQEHWRLHGYNDAPDSTIWNGEDVYDIFSQSERAAIDGSFYETW